jgi:hypothetical protein
MHAPMQAMAPMPGAPTPASRPPSYVQPTYEMHEAASYDLMVRRIIWAAFIIAIIAAVVIATR